MTSACPPTDSSQPSPAQEPRPPPARPTLEAGHAGAVLRVGAPRNAPPTARAGQGRVLVGCDGLRHARPDGPPARSVRELDPVSLLVQTDHIRSPTAPAEVHARPGCGATSSSRGCSLSASYCPSTRVARIANPVPIPRALARPPTRCARPGLEGSPKARTNNDWAARTFAVTMPARSTTSSGASPLACSCAASATRPGAAGHSHATRRSRSARRVTFGPGGANCARRRRPPQPTHGTESGSMSRRNSPRSLGGPRRPSTGATQATIDPEIPPIDGWGAVMLPLPPHPWRQCLAGPAGEGTSVTPTHRLEAGSPPSRVVELVGRGTRRTVRVQPRGDLGSGGRGIAPSLAPLIRSPVLSACARHPAR